MSNKAISTAAIAVAAMFLAGESKAQGTGELLWPDGKGGQSDDSLNFRPTLLSYPISGTKANGSAVVICPGGGYLGLAWEKEGEEVARKMNTFGMSAFVVKYRRAPGFKYPDPIDDGKRAMRMVRSRAKRLGLDTNRIGIMGFSAGGHLASTVSTHFDAGNKASSDSIERYGCKPAFSLLIYPVITMETRYTHGGSRNNLLGNPAPEELVQFLSNEKQVNKTSPPAFLVHTKDDAAVPWQNSQMYHDSCLKAGVKSKFILYPTGPHGFGLADGIKSPNLPALAGWPDSCAKWLDGLGIFKPQPSRALSRGQAKLIWNHPIFANSQIYPGENSVLRDLLGRKSPVVLPDPQ